MFRKIAFMLLPSTCLLLVGCSDNPLEGKWVLNPGQNDLLCQVGCKKVEYTAKEMIWDGLVLDVSYEIRGKTVIVRQEGDNFANQMFGDQAITMIDDFNFSSGDGKCRWSRPKVADADVR